MYIENTIVCQRALVRLIRFQYYRKHRNDVIMGAMASEITSLTIVYSTVYSGADQRKHQSPASLAFVRGIHRWPVNSPHKWPVTRKTFPLDDVIMKSIQWLRYKLCWQDVVSFEHGGVISWRPYIRASVINAKYSLTQLPGQNGRHFADDIFACIFVNENFYIFT